MALIEVKNLEKTYYTGKASTPVLHGISFNINLGDFVAIMGPSGSGKSTLLNILCFLDHPTGGTYSFDGKSMDQYSDDELARIRNKKMGFVFQSFNLLPRTTVLDNVKLPLIYSGIKTFHQDKLAQQAIARVDLTHRQNYDSSQLSGGEKQRVAIARALVNSPQVIFADEPTGNLDSKTGKIIMGLIQELNDKGHTVILITHETYTAEYAERIIRLHDGIVVSDMKVNHRHYVQRDGFKK